MKIGIIAGNRFLPIVIAKRIKEQNPRSHLVAICFRGETSRGINKFVDKSYWLNVGRLGELREAIRREELKEWIMAGQINPLHIYRRQYWDEELVFLIGTTNDFRPHSIFERIIKYLENENNIEFLDSTIYLKRDLAQEGIMNNVAVDPSALKDIGFGLTMITRFVELDIGQTLAVKGGSVVALESLEGTDRTIKRAYGLAGRGCTVLKFSKVNQDLRFDVPVVGISTIKLLKNIYAKALVLEAGKVIILEKERFMSLAKDWQIAIIGKSRVKQSSNQEQR